MFQLVSEYREVVFELHDRLQINREVEDAEVNRDCVRGWNEVCWQQRDDGLINRHHISYSEQLRNDTILLAHLLLALSLVKLVELHLLLVLL